MTTKIDLLASNNLSISLLNAMSEQVPADRMLEYFDITPDGDNTKVDVTVLVNGKPVDLVSELVRQLKYFEDKLDSIVLKKAQELIQKDSVLQELACEIEQADWKIRAKLEQLMNKD